MLQISNGWSPALSTYHIKCTFVSENAIIYKPCLNADTKRLCQPQSVVSLVLARLQPAMRGAACAVV